MVDGWLRGEFEAFDGVLGRLGGFPFFVFERVIFGTGGTGGGTNWGDKLKKVGGQKWGLWGTKSYARENTQKCG